MSTTGHNGNSTAGTLPARVQSTTGGLAPVRGQPLPVVLGGTDADQYGKPPEVTRTGPVSQKKAQAIRRLLAIPGVVRGSDLEEVPGGQ